VTERDRVVMLMAEREVADRLAATAPPRSLVKAIRGALRDAGGPASGYATARDYVLALEGFALDRLARHGARGG
jgi:hypothetical protein